MRPLIYLSSPYTDSDPWKQTSRLCGVRLMAAAMMLEGHTVYCPTIHGYQIHLEACPWIEKDQHDFWMFHDEVYLNACSSLAVLKLDGWQVSRGVQHEMLLANERRLHIHFLLPQRNIHEARAYIRDIYPPESPAPGVLPGIYAQTPRIDTESRPLPSGSGTGGESHIARSGGAPTPGD